jgi:hypothetical protein
MQLHLPRKYEESLHAKINQRLTKNYKIEWILDLFCSEEKESWWWRTKRNVIDRSIKYILCFSDFFSLQDKIKSIVKHLLVNRNRLTAYTCTSTVILFYFLHQKSTQDINYHRDQRLLCSIKNPVKSEMKSTS